MKKQVGSPEILKKSHSHKSKKDYSRKDKTKLFDIEINKNKLKNKLLKDFK